jgi:hypothetical protein
MRCRYKLPELTDLDSRRRYINIKAEKQEGRK